MKPIWLPFGLRPHDKQEETGPRYADIYERAIACGIDLWLLFLLLSDLFRWITGVVFQHADMEQLQAAEQAGNAARTLALLWNSGIFPLWMLNSFIQVAIIAFFIIGTQWLWGATPGKKVLGLQIVRRGTLEPLERWRFVVRFFGYIVSGMIFMIGFFWASFNKERRGWHDIMAGTVVIHTRPEGWYGWQIKRGFRWLKEKLFGSRPVE